MLELGIHSCVVGKVTFNQRGQALRACGCDFRFEHPSAFESSAKSASGHAQPVRGCHGSFSFHIIYIVVFPLADQLAIDRAFQSLCADLLTLASLLEVARPAGSPLDFHRNAAVLTAMNRCMRSGEALSDVLAPHSRAGSWRRTVEAINRERHAAGKSTTERD